MAFDFPFRNLWGSKRDVAQSDAAYVASRVTHIEGSLNESAMLLAKKSGNGAQHVASALVELSEATGALEALWAQPRGREQLKPEQIGYIAGQLNAIGAELDERLKLPEARNSVERELRDKTPYSDNPISLVTSDIHLSLVSLRDGTQIPEFLRNADTFKSPIFPAELHVPEFNANITEVLPNSPGKTLNFRLLTSLRHIAETLGDEGCSITMPQLQESLQHYSNALKVIADEYNHPIQDIEFHETYETLRATIEHLNERFNTIMGNNIIRANITGLKMHHDVLDLLGNINKAQERIKESPTNKVTDGQMPEPLIFRPINGAVRD